MLAVRFALDDLELSLKDERYPSEIKVYIDNQATLKTLNSFKLRGEVRVDLIERVKNFQGEQKTTLCFNWVKGHSGVLGNEMADEQAKMGCSSTNTFYIRPSLAYIKFKIRERAKKEWNTRWSNLKTCRQSRELITFPPNNRDAKFLFSKGRQGSRRIISLLTGHNNLKYHVFKRKVTSTNNPSPCCRFCESELETSKHLLYDCSRYDTRRREFIYCSENPKTGPDIQWYYDLARHLGIWDLLLDREYLDADYE